MINRRSQELDKFIDELVTVRFHDGEIRVGVLEYDESKGPGLPPSHEYSLYQFGPGRIFFKKTHVKSIKLWENPIIIP